MKYKVTLVAALMAALLLGVIVWERRPNALSVAEERFVGTWDLLPGPAPLKTKKITFTRDRTFSVNDKLVRESRWSVSNDRLKIHNDYRRTLFGRVPIGRHTETFSFNMDFNSNENRVDLNCVELPSTMVLVRDSKENSANDVR